MLKQSAQKLDANYQVYLNTKGLDKVDDTHRNFQEDIVARQKHVKAAGLNTMFQDWVNGSEEKMPWNFGKVAEFSLLRYHPALCGLFMANIRDEYHRTSIDFASNQGQILVVAHLYNAVKQSGLLPRDGRWADMDWIIEQQGSDWMFVGKKPKQGNECGKHLAIAIGLLAHEFAKDYKTPKGGKRPKTIVGYTRRLEYHARYSELSFDKEPKFEKPSGPSKAKDDILLMVDVLTKDYLSKDAASTQLTSLNKLRTFKIALKKDEIVLAFDVLDLYLRCIKLLQKIQIHALVYAPHDYPRSKFTGGLTINSVIGEMLYDLGSKPRHNDSVFPSAATMLCKVIKEEVSVVIAKAKALREEIKLQQQAESTSEEEPNSKNPYEDITLKDRNMFRGIFFQDANRSCRMPFSRR